ncbi:MAG TPA: hypothetical protein VGV39_15090 [Mesorhizobium sp.]|jgi:hypothetical protein|uniref:hypothetical protein n=1 Tax=Mesorhizobium sp. TaxID=1871066 RepID=UPI002DDDAB6E|nr:hypothetical protein [Mesorhizobium sp.]HEV2504402.1 hypothetical protein [Mesorhizobium sp.]
MLARLAQRIAAIEALKGRTFVGANVLDSQIGALDVAADGSIRTDRDQPFIAVYTDVSKADGQQDHLRALHRSGATDLTIEVGIAASMTELHPETGETVIVGLGIPVTDPAMEFYLDCIGRQVVNALTDPRNAWAEVWRGLSSGINRVERRRASDATGVRIAAHQIVVNTDLLPDPVFGEPVAATSIWTKLLAQMEATNHPQREMVLSLIGDPDGVLEHEAQRRRFGMTLDEARALFDIAVEPGETTEPDVTSVTSERA